MKELDAIFSAWCNQTEKRAALATLVQTSGSTYRRPGARMLILSDGTSVGSISGGCLERDVVEKGVKLMGGSETMLLTYDTTSEEDLVFGVGMGCNGVVHILLEPAAAVSDALKFMMDTLYERLSVVLATVFRVSGKTSASPGRRLVLACDGDIVRQIKDDFPDEPPISGLREKMLAAATEVQASGRSKVYEIELTGGRADVFVEVIHAPTPLVIFGAGYDAVPLVRLAREMGFEVTVTDVRPAYATLERFPEADWVTVIRPEQVSELGLTSRKTAAYSCLTGLTDRTAAIIMSHNYLTDRAFLKELANVPLRYLGLMGPRARARKMVEELRQEGMDISEEDLLAKVHNPVGLDIGAETPEQIALAILAEIQATFSGHTGGLLREKKTSIHARPDGKA